MHLGVVFVDIDFNALLIGNALNEFQNREEIRFVCAKLSGKPTVLSRLKVGDDVAVVAVVDRHVQLTGFDGLTGCHIKAGDSAGFYARQLKFVGGWVAAGLEGGVGAIEGMDSAWVVL